MFPEPSGSPRRRAPRWFISPALVPVVFLASFLNAGGSLEPPKLDDSEVVFLQPWLGRSSLAEAINAYATPGGTLIPLGEICRLLAFPIEVDAEKGVARGTFLTSQRPFSLDLNTGVATTGDQKVALAPASAIRQDREILVDASLLEAWFPLAVKVDLKAATLTFTSKEKLPIEEQWEREGRYASLSMGAGSAESAPIGVELPTPYRLFDVPFADFTAAWSRSQTGGSGQPQVSAALAGDLLWMSSSIFVSRDSEGKTSGSRITLYREDFKGGLLGALHARRVELGNLMQSPSLDLAGDLPTGRGVLVDNYPIGYRSRFATRSFQGRLPEGWTVELYQNNALTSVQKPRPDGLYEFQEVPLRFGLNLFRLVFHGPMGERREETYRADIASDLPAPGAIQYRLAGVRPVRPEAGGGSMGATPPPEDVWSRPAFMADADWGLSRTFALNTGAAKVRLEDGDHWYRVLGLRGLFSYLSFQASVARENSPETPDGRATECVVRSGYGYASVSLRRSDYRDGFRPIHSPQDVVGASLLRSETALDLFGTVNVKGHPVGVSFARELRQYEDGDRTVQDKLKASFNVGDWSISPGLSRVSRSQQPGPAPLDLTLFASSFGGKVAFQGELDARREGGRTTLTGWQGAFDITGASGLVYRLGLKGSDTQIRHATLFGSLSRMSGPFGYGVDAQYARSGGYVVSLRVQASFGREPRTGRWARNAQPMAGLGAVSALAFLDGNGNGVLDPGDEILEDTRFKMGGQPVENGLSDHRVTFRTQLSRGQETAIQLDESSLDDPAMQAMVEAYRIVPRAGHVTRVEMPVARFGEIVGSTRIRREGGVADYGGLELELLKPAGERVRLFRSAYDGFFEIRDLPLGDYLLRVSPAEAARLKLKEPPVRTFHIDSVKNLFEGQDLVVEQATAEPAVSTQKAAP